MTVQIILGDALTRLRELPADSVHCCVTSPPYFGLRDYKVEGQIGLERTPEEFIAKLVEVFRELRRVLRPDGTLWLNIGDSYASEPTKGRVTAQQSGKEKYLNGQRNQCRFVGGDIKAKDLMMIPARLALALRSDGWWLRKDIIWHKPNPMPESAMDRPTSSHEHVFLLAKFGRYHYDAAAVREPFADGRQGRDYKMPDGWATHEGGHGSFHKDGREKGRPARERNRGGRADGFAKPNNIDPSANGGRNLRDVWSIATAPFPGAHYATFPPALVEPCIKAGCPKGGTVIDPFGGAGTTGLVADRLGRNAILIEINPHDVDMAKQRIEDEAPMLASVEVVGEVAQ